ncbi:hypothetical protein Poly24_55410 [Rosistilla carotiformis]|uniref:Uncharacterized protein n=2 Tax=Rosistilla carotiformis TaxID=2528017 RepID=A0A518K1X0_9BACT|nr:hypothetical protein Poly24_55410 [Rosistilla carotiformis]
MMDCAAAMPRYVLRKGLHPLGPVVKQMPGEPAVSAIFAFSSKPQYDAFLRAGTIPLTPYPLVKGFLQNQDDLEVLHLMVLDANSPNQSVIYAATFQAALEALEQKHVTVLPTYHLIRDEKSDAYRVQSPEIVIRQSVP